LIVPCTCLLASGHALYPETRATAAEPTGASAKDTAAASATAPPDGNATKVDRLQLLAGHVGEARRQYAAEQTLGNEVRLATWLLAFGEMATTEPELGLWTNAVDALEEGQQMLSEIEGIVEKDPDLETQIAAQPVIAMRLDAARVRQAETEKRNELARDKERERLRRLRELVRVYRDLAYDLSLAQMQFLLGDAQEARNANQSALGNIAKIQAIAQAEADYHLFFDEPSLDGQTDFDVANAAHEPVSANMVSLAKSLQALMTLRLAEGDGRHDPALVNEATQWARAALGEPAEVENLPAGHDADNVLAHFVLGESGDAAGEIALSADRFDVGAEKAAGLHYQTARQHLKKVGELVGDSSADNATDSIQARARILEANLKDAQAYLERVRQLTAGGDVRQASEEAKEALLRHPTIDVWVAYAETARRAGQSPEQLLNEIDKATAAGVIAADDPHVQLARAKLDLAAVWQVAGQQGLANLPRQQLTGVDQRLSALEQRLRATAANAGQHPLQGQLEAHAALAAAYRAMVAPARSGAERELTDGYRAAQDAAASLEGALSDADADEIGVREALIAARLAQGYLALRVLPNYRDESLLAFSAAFDEMAKLPFGAGNVKVLGSPMLTALRNRPDAAASRLAQDERQLRQMMSGFVEAAFAMQYGEPGPAAERMAEALRGAQIAGTSGRPLDATMMLGQADGFDAQITLRESVRAFKSLGDAAAGRDEVALVEALRILTPEAVPENAATDFAEEIDDPTLDRAVSQIQSPLAGFALVTALEQSAAGIEASSSDPRRVRYLKYALAAQKQTAQLLSASRLAGKYPHLVAMNEQAGQRLGSADFYTARAERLRMRGELDAAREVYLDGVKRHPRSQPLWQGLIVAQLDHIRRAGEGDERLGDVLGQVQAAADAGFLSDHQLHLYQGLVYERMQDEPSALASYEKAVTAAKGPEEKVLGKARTASLRARLSLRSVEPEE